MCVRYVLKSGDLYDWIEKIESGRGKPTKRTMEEIIYREEAFPGDTSVIAIPREGLLTLEPARWGLMPYWAKAPEYNPDFGKKNAYNARAETVFEKPTFRAAAKYRRCLIPATAFYERAHGRWLRMEFREPGAFAFAGLFADPEPGVSDTTTFTMVTTTPNETISEVHDRMPVVLEPRDYEAWLDLSNGRDALRGLLVPSPPDWFTIKDAGPVSKPKKAESPALF